MSPCYLLSGDNRKYPFLLGKEEREAGVEGGAEGEAGVEGGCERETVGL